MWKIGTVNKAIRKPRYFLYFTGNIRTIIIIMSRLPNLENDYFEVARSKIDEINSDIKKTSLFSHYIWTHNIFAVEKLDNKYHLGQPKPEDPKILSSKSQAILMDRNHSTANTKKTEDDEKIRKINKKRSNGIGRLNSNFEKVDKLMVMNKPSYIISEKIEEMIKEEKAKRKNELNRFQDMYFELFSGSKELQSATLKKNQEFTERISNLQRELRPEMSKLPALHSESIVKIGFKAKPAKV